MRKFFFAILFFALAVSNAFAVPGMMNVSGSIQKPDGTAMESNPVSFRFSILNKDGDCVIYVEQTSYDLTGSKGRFEHQLGSGTASFQGAADLNLLFKNSGSVNCQAGGTYSPASGDNRQIIIQFNDGASGWQTFPSIKTSSVPAAFQASHAETASSLAGFGATNLLRVENTGAPGPAPSLNNTQVSELLNILAGTSANYVRTNSGASTALPTLGTSNQVLGVTSGGTGLEYKSITAGPNVTITPSAGSIQISATGGGGGVSSVNMTVPGYMSVSGGPITSAGTFGLGFSNQSQNMVFAGPTSGTGPVAFRALNISDIRSTGTGSWLGASGSCTTGQALYYNSATDKLECGSLALTSAQIIAGLGFTPAAAGSGVSSLNGQTGPSQSFATGTSSLAPTFTSSSNTHTLNIPSAGTAGVAAGTISKTEYDIFNNKLGPSTGFAGDVTGTSSSISVVKIRGRNVLPTTPSNGQVLTYNGSDWAPAAAASSLWNTSGSDIYFTSGNVGIGTTSPAYKLDVSGYVNFSNSLSITGGTVIDNNRRFFAGSGTASTPGYIFGNDTNSGMFSPTTSNLAFSTNSSERLRIDSDGNVGIGTSTPDQKLVVFNGSSYGRYTTSGWTHSSDKRLKHDIKPLENSLEKILQLRGVSYLFNSDTKNKEQLGFIAQEVEPIFPEVVVTDSNGFKSMVYANLVAPIIESIKVIYTRLSDIEVEQNISVQKIEQLKAENAAMKSYLCAKDLSAPFCKQ